MCACCRHGRRGARVCLAARICRTVRIISRGERQCCAGRRGRLGEKPVLCLVLGPAWARGAWAHGGARSRHSWSGGLWHNGKGSRVEVRQSAAAIVQGRTRSYQGSEHVEGLPCNLCYASLVEHLQDWPVHCLVEKIDILKSAADCNVRRLVCTDTFGTTIHKALQRWFNVNDGKIH